jgi:hypothetical protein
MSYTFKTTKFLPMARRTTGRIDISANPKNALELALTVYKKHQAEGSKSILNELDGYDWAVTGPRIAPCLANHEEAEKMRKKSEELYLLRDVDMDPINKILRASKNILKGKYAKNPKALGDWGFTVDDTPRPKKPKA